MKPPALERFLEKVSSSVVENTFVRLVLTGPGLEGGEAQRASIRHVEIQGQPCFSVTTHVANQAVVENLPIATLDPWLRSRFPLPYRSALLGTTQRDWQLVVKSENDARLVSHKPAQTSVPSRSHDLAKVSALDSKAKDWLQGLGIVDPQGKVRASRADKYQQIHRYLEILDHQMGELSWDADRPIHIADMGSGKGYLTFAVWHWLHRIAGRSVRVQGIEARPHLVEECNQVARSIGATGLEFAAGSIESAPLESVDILIALHACNVATDHAILKGVRAKAKAILVAPCCHQDLRPQMTDPAVFRSILRHGLFKERLAEWLTDGLRALYLEQAGYKTKAIEFVSSEHTTKNLLLCAVRSESGKLNEGLSREIVELKAFFGISSHPLDALLQASALNVPTGS